MSQSEDNWHTLSWAMDNNPILIGLHLFAGTVLALSFFTIGSLMLYSITKQGFFSTEHKIVSVFFITFVLLCGSTFVVREIMFYYPLYWVYGGVKLVAAFTAALTAILYIKSYKKFLTFPTRKEVDELQKDKELADKKVNLLSSHLKAWSEDVGYHIEILKGKHKELAEDLASRGIPATTITEDPSTLIHDTDEAKARALMSLEKIKAEIEALTQNIHNLEK